MRPMTLCGLVCILLAASTTGWGYDCGDADGNGWVTMQDVVYMMDYMFAGGPPPADLIDADYDDHELLTIADAALLASTDWSCDIFIPLCPPDEPQWVPGLDPEFRIMYPERFPASESEFALTLTLTMPDEFYTEVYGMCLPLVVTVDGQIPTIDSVEFPMAGSDFSSERSRYSLKPDDGIVLFGAGCRFWFGASGIDQFATVYLSMPTSEFDREIKLAWDTLSPGQAAEEDNSLYPMIVGYCLGHITLPDLYPHCCVVPGDANDDGITNISDAVYLVGCIFTGCTGLPCHDQADASGEGLVNISDAVYLIYYIFTEGPPPVCGYSGG